MFALRRPAPLILAASPILSYNSLSSLGSDLDSGCDTPGLLNLNRDESSTQTASDFDSPPETPIRPITDVSLKYNEHLDDSNGKQGSSNKLDDQQILQITTTLLKSDESGAPHLIHNPSYWSRIDGESQEDLGYEAEAEGQVVAPAGLVGHHGSGHWKAGSRPRRQRTDSMKAKRIQPETRNTFASWMVEDGFDGSTAERSSPATQLQSFITPTPSPIMTPTATPKLSSAPPRAIPIVRSAQSSTMRGLGLGLPPCISKGNVELEISPANGSLKRRERPFQGRIHSVPAPEFSPSTPVLTATPRFASPLHQLPLQRVSSLSPLELVCPPPPMRLRPTLIDGLLSPLELPESWLSKSDASSESRLVTPLRLHRPNYLTRRSASLTALLNKKDGALNDPESPFHSPIPPALVRSPRLKAVGATRQTTQRRTSSVRLYAEQIHERRPSMSAGRPTRDQKPAFNAPPLGFLPIPLSPEMPPVNRLPQWTETQEKFKDLCVSSGGVDLGDIGACGATRFA